MVGSGDTHSEQAYREWLAATGYRSVEVVRLVPTSESLVSAVPGR